MEQRQNELCWFKYFDKDPKLKERMSLVLNSIGIEIES